MLHTTIYADCILANLLQKHEQVTTRDLNCVRTAIEKNVHSIYVDVTGDCIVWAVNCSPDMFSFCDNVIKRKRRWSQDYVDQSFNWCIPNDVRQNVIDILMDHNIVVS